MNHRGTVVRSIRLEKRLMDSIEKLSRTKNLTPNSLIASALTKYVEWDVQAEKYGYVAIPLDMVEAFLNAFADEKLSIVARDLGSRLLNDMLHFWYARANSESFAAYLSLTSKYGGLANYEFDSNGGQVTLVIRHRLGRKGSIFLSTYYQKGLKDVFGIEAESDVSTNQVILRWKNAPTSERPRHQDLPS